jgi:hypothetical protein
MPSRARAGKSPLDGNAHACAYSRWTTRGYAKGGDHSRVTGSTRTRTAENPTEVGIELTTLARARARMRGNSSGVACCHRAQSS